MTALRLPSDWHQDHLVYSRRGVIRGLHIKPARLVHVAAGAIQSVSMDLRKNSPTRGKTFSVILRSDNPEGELLFVPEGFAHGFLTLEDTLVSIRCTNSWDLSKEGVNPLGAGIKWIVTREDGAGIHGMVSSEDQAFPSLVDYLNR